MKNYFIPLLSIALATTSLSCSQVEPTNPNDRIHKGSVAIGAEIPMTKTHLGEATNGIYKINWSVGDKINVNGKISEPLSEEEHGLNNARFTGEAHKSINVGVITEEDASDEMIWK